MEEQTVNEIEGLRVGAIVGYVLYDGNNEGQVRPAIVVKIWDHITGCSQLQVFMDGDGTEGFNDSAPNIQWETSILYDEDKTPGTWHFIGD